jgi:hypothetical protein
MGIGLALLNRRRRAGVHTGRPQPIPSDADQFVYRIPRAAHSFGARLPSGDPLRLIAEEYGRCTDHVEPGALERGASARHMHRIRHEKDAADPIRAQQRGAEGRVLAGIARARLDLLDRHAEVFA